MKAKANTNIWRSIAQYNYLHGKRVHLIPKFVTGQRAFLDKLPLAVTPCTADRIGTTRSKMIKPQKAKNVTISRVRMQTVVMDKKSNFDRVAICQIKATTKPKIIKHAPKTQTCSTEKRISDSEHYTLSAKR